MNRLGGWDQQAAAAFLNELARRHGQARRREASQRLGLLDWACRYLPEHFRLPPSRMHRRVAELLQWCTRRRGARLNVLGPRGSAKSTLASLAYPLWAVLERGEPYVWLVSDTVHQARAHLENIRAELEENNRLVADYSERLGGARHVAGRLRFADGASIEALGTGQRIRGKRQRRHRPSLIIADDIQNDDHMVSPRRRQRSRDWFFGTLVAAGTPRTNVIHLATALHHDALGLELSRTAGWHSELFRAVIRWPEDMELWNRWEEIYRDSEQPDAPRRARQFYQQHATQMQRGALVLWPELEDLYTLMCLRAEMGRAAFAREKQNSPVAPELCEWPEEYFADRIWSRHMPEAATRVVAVDPSKGNDARRGDFSAIVMLAAAEDGRLYVEADLARRPVDRLLEDTAACCRRFRPQALGIEANQFQELLAEPLEAEFRRQGQWGVSPWLIRNRTNKLLRIRRLGPLLARDRLRFLAGSPGTRLLVEQLQTFPVGDHDDGPDALEMALRLLDALTAPEPTERLAGRMLTQ